MVYTSYSDITSNDFQGFSSRYVDVVLGGNESREYSKYMPVRDFYHREETNRSVGGLSSKGFMFSKQFLEDVEGSPESIALEEHVDQLKKKEKQKKRGAKSISTNTTNINIPK